MKFFSDKNLQETGSLNLEDYKENHSIEENETKGFIKHLENMNQEQRCEISSIHNDSSMEDNLFNTSYNDNKQSNN